MKKSTLYVTGLMALFLSLASCNKDDVANSLQDSQLLKTSATIDYVNETDFQTGMETASTHSSLSARHPDPSTSLDACPVVTVQSATFPKVFTVDYGTSCSNNGITRSGSLTITITNYLMENGSHMTISRNNYYVNGYKVEGDVVYVNETTNPAVPQWTRTVSNGQITTPAGLLYTHSGTRTVKQIEGVSTLATGDNVFEVSAGTATVTRPGGSSLTATITTPLIKKNSCEYISQGVMHLDGTLLNGDLDYGTNECDDIAIYTNFSGLTYTIHL